MGRLIDLTEKIFGRLTVIGRDYSVQGTNQKAKWFCNCNCGTKNISILSDSLRNGKSISCGCYQKEVAAKNAKITGTNQKKHGISGTPEYNSWNNMIQRCYNKNDIGYLNYGGRGITVCDKWLNSIENFIEDMGPRPSDDHSLDRINNNGNYELSNCRWATITEQNRNKRDTVISLEQIEKIKELYKTGNYSQQELGNKYGCTQSNIYCIVNNKTWT